MQVNIHSNILSRYNNEEATWVTLFNTSKTEAENLRGRGLRYFGLVVNRWR
jgi:hypothetical protein